MTQPGVSIYIGQLESYLGVKLINRKDGRFELTREGRAVFKCAEKVHRIQAEFEKLASGFKADQVMRLTVGATPTYCKCHMPEVVARFSNSHPGAQIRIESDNSDILEKRLLSMEIDVAVAPNYKPSSQVWSMPFATEELMLIASETHELASRESVSVQEIKEYPLALREEGSATRKMVLSYLRSAGITPLVAIEVNNMEFMREWILQNKGISIVSRSAAMRDQRVKVIPLKEKLYLEVFVLCLKARRYEMPISRFIRHLIE